MRGGGIVMEPRAVTILVVEDNELDVEKLTRCLRKLRIRNPVIRARNGLEALHVLRGTGDKPQLQEPYVILLDLNMPRMNGIEFLREVRSDALLRTAPVVVLSTSDHSKDMQAAHRLGIVSYLVKPLEIDTLIDTLQPLEFHWLTDEESAMVSS